MDRVTAQHVINGFSSPVTQMALEAYVTSRIETLRVSLETSKDPGQISELQGAILELRKLLKVRETAGAVLELERKR